MVDVLVLGGPVMWVLMLCSVVTLAVIVDRVLFLRAIRENPDKIIAYVTRSMSGAEFSTEAFSHFKDRKGPVGTLVREFISCISSHRMVHRDAVDRHLERVGRSYVSNMESYLGILRVMAVISPLLGLLGTVFGIMDSFNILAMSSGLARPEIVSAGIAEALLTTAAGLIISILAISFSSFFDNRIDRAVESMERAADQMADFYFQGEEQRLTA